MSWRGEADLLSRVARHVREEDRPLAFVLGSGTSNGIPGTREMVAYFRGTLERDESDLEYFDAEVDKQPKVAQKYQRAAEIVMDRAGINTLNRAVRLAVLRAHSPRLTPELARSVVDREIDLKALEKDWRAWTLPRGTTHLGRLFAELPERFRGPVLTTNFDPFVELSLASVGLVPKPIPVDRDGAVLLTAEPGEVSVVHLHGYWTSSDTMHTTVQLQTQRPQLSATLRKLLSGHTVLVIGYSGWDDVFTSTLNTLVGEGSSREVDVLWACYGDKPQMGRLAVDATPRITPYTQITSNTFFPTLYERLSTAPNHGYPAPGDSMWAAPTAWAKIDSALVTREAARTVNDSLILSYYDGRSPQWRDITSGRVPTLSIATRLKQAVAEQEPSTLLLLLPAAEGKSTAMMQVAVHYGQLSNDWRVLWARAGARLDVEALVELSPYDGHYLLLIDDADLHYSSVKGLKAELLRRGRDDISVVLAARDTDWFYAARTTTLRQGFDETASRDHELTREDAELLVAAWSTLGRGGLGKLVSQSTDDDRASAVLASARQSADGRGQLLGALLDVRFGNDLSNHVLLLLQRLKRTPLPSDLSLADAFAAVCLAARTGGTPLPLKMLKSFCGLSSGELESLVVQRLGREAASEVHGTSIRARHAKIAEAYLDLCPEEGVDLQQILCSLVAAATGYVQARDYSEAEVAWSYCGHKIEDDALAIAAAETAAALEPRQLRYASNLFQVLRIHGRYDRVRLVAEQAWGRRASHPDVGRSGRQFLFDWARVEHLEGKLENAASLAGAAMSDDYLFGDLDRDLASRALLEWARCQSAHWAPATAPPALLRAAATFAEKLDDRRELSALLISLRSTLGPGEESAAQNLLSGIEASMKRGNLKPAKAWRSQPGTLTQLARLLER